MALKASLRLRASSRTLVFTVSREYFRHAKKHSRMPAPAQLFLIFWKFSISLSLAARAFATSRSTYCRTTSVIISPRTCATRAEPPQKQGATRAEPQ